MKWFFEQFSSAFQRFVPAVRADDGEEETPDPQVHIRNECEKSECAKWFEKLQKCNNRVLSKKKTSESCDEEMVDFINCLDECVAKTLFTKLK